MFHLRTAARRTTLRTSSRRRPFTTATPQEKVKTWVQDNQKTLGGGILALVVLKYLTRSVTDAWRRLFLCVFQCLSCLYYGALPSRCPTLSHRTYPFLLLFPRTKPPVVDEKFDTLTLTVPQGKTPGDEIPLTNPHMPNLMYTATVPQGASAGKSFKIKVPKCPKQVKVVVPVDWTEGESISVHHPGRPLEEFTVKVPEGTARGSSFAVALP